MRCRSLVDQEEFDIVMTVIVVHADVDADEKAIATTDELAETCVSIYVYMLVNECDLEYRSGGREGGLWEEGCRISFGVASCPFSASEFLRFEWFLLRFLTTVLVPSTGNLRAQPVVYQ